VADKKNVKSQTLSYNDIYLRLARAKEQLQNFNPNGDPNDLNLISASNPKVKDLQGQIAQLQTQLQEATPTSQYTAEQAGAASAAIVKIREQRNQLIAQGEDANSPEIQKLANEYKQQNAIYNQWQNDQQGIDELKKNADVYVAQQNTALKNKNATNLQNNSDTAQLAALQKQRDIGVLFGEDTSKIDAQIASLSKGVGTPATGVAANQNTGGTAQTLNGQSSSGKSTGGKTPDQVTHAGQLGTPSNAPMGENSGWDAATTNAEQKSFIQKYGGIAAWAAATPWMENYLNQAIKGGWTADKFTQAIHADPNWQKVGQSTRDYDTAFYGNAQAWAQQYNDKLKLLQESALRQGYDPSIFGQSLGDNPTPDQIKAAAAGNSGTNTFLQAYFSNTPDQTTLDRFVASHASISTQADKFTPEGKLATTAAGLKQYAQQYGINPNTLPSQWTGAAGQGKATGDWFTSTADAISQGYTTLDSEQAAMRTKAAQLYKPFAAQIANGESVQSLAGSYLGTASNLLEKPADNFTLGDFTGTNGLITKALQGDGTNPLPLDQFMSQIKATPEWLTTGNARNSLMDTASSILQGFGLVH